MKDKLLILGRGYIGGRLHEELGGEFFQERISSFKETEERIKKISPSIIINSIGYIGRNVDDCELDIDKTLLSNSFVPVILGEIALRNNIRLVHISTGCTFHYDYGADKPITEDKTPDFLDLFYSRSKAYSEEALKLLCVQYPVLILRIRVPLDNRKHKKNILDKLIGYDKVIDLPNSVTYIPDFILALKHLIKIKATGIYNTVNKGGLRYPELLDVYKKHVPNFSYKIVDYRELNMVRTNLILSTRKLENSGFKVRDIHEVLEECVEGYLKY
ncbi:MAG TPA: sugar nucleotide-binding protein [Candidatus Margulisiibacteriota bacterium]|nr:sugar nucleotide-binding protein [Candidatus Margulisiibacteriota bacterium]